MTTPRFAAPRPVFVVLLALALVGGMVAIALPRIMDARHEADLTATRELAAAVTLPAPAVEGCDPLGDVRCWTTPAEGRDAIAGIAGILEALGVTELTDECTEMPGRITVPTCFVRGSYLGEVVAIFARPTVLPDPPIRSSGTTITLWATVR